MKTTAILKYRCYIPYGWIAVPFCRLEFTGSETVKFDSKWDKIRTKLRKQNELTESEIAKSIAEKRTELEDIQNDLTQFKRWWRFWRTPEEKQLYDTERSIAKQIKSLKEKRERYKTGPSADTLLYEAKKLLRENDFTCISVTTDGSECTTYTEVWGRE